MKTSKRYVWVPDGDYQTVRMFSENGWIVTETVIAADLVVFTGGSDVTPALYGEKSIPSTASSELRDRNDLLAYSVAKKYNKPCFGICRGLQFLNVMNMGKMWQHVDSHAIGERGHKMYVEDGFLPYPAKEDHFVVNSYHHQMVIPPDGAMVLGWSIGRSISRENATRKVGWKDLINTELEKEPEIVYYNATNDIGVQFHPEYKEKGNIMQKIAFAAVEWVL